MGSKIKLEFNSINAKSGMLQQHHDDTSCKVEQVQTTLGELEQLFEQRFGQCEHDIQHFEEVLEEEYMLSKHIANTQHEVQAQFQHSQNALDRRFLALHQETMEIREFCCEQSEQLNNDVRTSEQRLGQRLEQDEMKFSALQECSNQCLGNFTTLDLDLHHLQQKLEAWKLSLATEVAECIEQHFNVLVSRLDSAEQRVQVCESQLEVSNKIQQQVIVHCDDLQRISLLCKEIPKHFEMKLEKVRAAMKEDIAASALSAFQGEERILVKL